MYQPLTHIEIALITVSINSSSPKQAYITPAAFFLEFLLYAANKNQVLKKLSSDARKKISGKRNMERAGRKIAKHAITMIRIPIMIWAMSMIVPSFLGE